MLLTIDVGNTNTHLGVYDKQDLVASWTITTFDRRTADELVVSLRNLFALADKPIKPAAGIIACVVPQVQRQWADACAKLCARSPLVVGPGLKTGIRMRYNDPAEIGADRIADFIAAKDEYKQPCIIVDLGTATNMEVIDEDGFFCGGVIAPGLASSARALASSAAQITLFALQPGRHTVGRSTREAVQSGIFFGEIARIDGLIEMIWQELGYRTSVIATGGDAEYLWKRTKHIEGYDPNLTLKGLRLLYERNRPTPSGR